jgi:transcription elongation factor GreA
MDNDVVMTAQGLEELKREIEHLETHARNEIAQQIKTAREWGDLKENAEYHEAKRAQSHLETKILQLREQLQNAKVVESAEGSDVAGLGSTVEVEDEESGRNTTYVLVSALDANPAERKVSFESPIGVALRNKRAGETAKVQTPKGERRLKVVSVS